MSSHPSAALVIGAGDATGGAIARRFAREGLTACVVRRNADKLAPLVDAIEAAGGRAVHVRRRCAQRGGGRRAGRRASSATSARSRSTSSTSAPTCPSSILDETARKYFKVWEMACFAGFLTAREVGEAHGRRAGAARCCSPAPPPRCAAARTSLRSPARSTRCARWRRASRANSARKASTSATSSSTARIDTEFIRTQFPERYALKDQDGILDPDHIAENYWFLHTQPRDAWTFELDLRPWIERW